MHMFYVHLIVGLRAGEMVVSDVKCLLKKHGNLSLILRTHKKKKKSKMVADSVGETETGESLGLTGQPRLTSQA